MNLSHSRGKTGVFIALFMALALIPGSWLGWSTWVSQTSMTGNLPVRDYLNIWAAGTLIRTESSSLLFDMKGYWDWLRTLYAPGLTLHSWSYPPPALFLAVPLSFFSVTSGFLVWTAGTLAFLLATLRLSGTSRTICICVALSPAVLDNALAGQNGALLATALAGGVLLIDRRPIMACLCLGLLILKPQAGLLLPVALLASRQWRIAFGTAAVASALALLSAAVFGADVWKGFLTVTGPFMTNTILHAEYGSHYQFMMPTIFMAMRGWGGGLFAAYAAQAVVSLLCAAAVWKIWSDRGASLEMRAALLLLLSPIASPYSMTYDLVTSSIAVALVASRALRDGIRPPEASVLGLAWLWPGIAVSATLSLVPGIGTAVLAGSGYFAWKRRRS